jgi:hypothetical protein
MQILVRPLVNGAYYKPGDGADSVIAESAASRCRRAAN